MIPTNQLQITFDRAAIEKKFVILEVKRDSGNYQHSLIPDLALQAARALAVVYEYGALCYILYARQNLDYKNLKKVLESESEDISLREISSTELKDHLLAQLLCNAMPALGADGRMYHNLTGKLYYQQAAWRQGRGEVPRSFWTLRIQLTWDRCVKLSVVTFCQAERKRGAPAEAQYLFDTKSGFLRRLVQEDPDRTSPRFVIGSLDPAHKHTVSFLEFGSWEDFQRCRVGVLHRFLQDVKELLAPYLILHVLFLPEDLRLGDKELDPRSENIKARLREVPLYLEDTVGDAASAALAALLHRELEQYSGITLQDGTPKPGEALFRIVHNKETYADCPERDPYRKAPRHCAVQHLTVEDFQLSGLDRTGAKPKEDAPLRKVLQEMAVKLDVLHGQITCYDWETLGYEAAVNFVIPDDASGKDKLLSYRRLRVFPDGRLQFSRWQDQMLWEDAEQEKIAAAFHNKFGNRDSDVDGIVYENPDDIHIIRQTERFTLPQADHLNELLASTRDEEWLNVAPLLSVVQSLVTDAEEKDRQNLEILCSDLAELAPQAPRRQLRACLKLKTSLGKYVNKEIYARTGVRIGSGIKGKDVLEELMGGALGIRQFTQGNAQYYYGGRLPKSLQHSLPHACRIRKVTSTSGTPHFERYLPLMEVEFVRAGAWTVLPFPFKYLREWKPV
ncbi:hypothetical protein [uncultured Subdoligranulum sp.]|uniref:hypothetical protein n=1 Tax=uncultured Subdoligranulum sp. TaxID=512298 RepID=UPI003209D1A1